MTSLKRLSADPRKSNQTHFIASNGEPSRNISEVIINQSTNQIEWKNHRQTHFVSDCAKTFSFLGKNHVKIEISEIINQI